jgi:uncharacterized protein YdaU (DUF1376 family)
MSLEWFEFHPKPFITDTMRLSTEAKGAYLLLMLDYYETEAPAPDDDEVLAAITGLPIETWRRHRRVIEPLFQVSGGLWHHATCAQVIEDAHIRIAKASAKGKEAAFKRWNGKARGNAKGNAGGMPQAMPAVSPEHTTGNAHASADLGPEMPRAMPTAMPQAMPTASEMPRAYHGHSPEHATGIAPGMHLSQLPIVREGANAPSSAIGLSIGSLIPDDFYPTGEACSQAKADGVTGPELAEWIDDWKDRCQQAGTRLDDWQLAWQREYKRRLDTQKPKAKPRVSVSKKRLEKIPDGWSPGVTHHKIAGERGLNIIACLESFADYLVNKRPDWKDVDAAFRQWLKSPHRTEFTRNGQAQPTRRAPAPGGSSIIDAFDRLDATLAGRGGAIEEGEPDGQAAVRRLPQG